ncbi:MAG: TPM domain-containing protein [Pseudorhodoplanes sp.]|uniref:TPM domain-containing protein n=1 Tax=Pseudorhodoplanes sp. TaxID=1934341 RepID=UPI003D107AC9
MLISDDDKKRISATIAAAERTTAGEIFCVIARQSGDYRLVPIVWAAFAALLLPFPLILLTTMTAHWIYIAQLALFVVAALLLSIPAIRFHIVPRRRMQEQAHAEAVRQFLAQGLHKTENRTGVLIFASEAEHYAEVIADEGVDAKVPQQVWDDAVAVLIAGIADGRPADGFVAAVERCGAVLAQHFPPGALNRNELPDKLIEI